MAIQLSPCDQPHLEPESPSEPPSSIKEPEVVYVKEVILKARVSFEKKKLDLRIYTFNVTFIEKIIEETILDKNHQV